MNTKPRRFPVYIPLDYTLMSQCLYLLMKMDLSLYACMFTFSILAWSSICAYLAWVQDSLLFGFSTCEIKWNQIQLVAIITLRQMSTNFLKIHELSPNSRCWKDDIKQIPYSVLTVLEWPVNLNIIWCFLLSTCELIHISVCNGKNFNNVLKISGIITPNLVDWVMCPGSVHRSFKVCSDAVMKQI